MNTNPCPSKLGIIFALSLALVGLLSLGIGWRVGSVGVSSDPIASYLLKNRKMLANIADNKAPESDENIASMKSAHFILKDKINGCIFYRYTEAGPLDSATNYLIYSMGTVENAEPMLTFLVNNWPRKVTIEFRTLQWTGWYLWRVIE